MTLRAVLATIRRNLILAVVVIVVCALGGAAIALLIPDRYQTTTQILFQPADAGGTSTSGAGAISLLESQLPTYAALVDTPTVLDPVAKQLSVTSAYLSDQVSATVVADTAIVTITVNGTSPSGAAQLANSVGTSLIQQVSELDPTGTGTAKVAGSVVSAPIVPTVASNPGPLVGGLLGLVVGLVLAYIVVVLRESLAASAPRRSEEPGTDASFAIEPLQVPGTLGRA